MYRKYRKTNSIDVQQLHVFNILTFVLYLGHFVPVDHSCMEIGTIV